MSVQPLPWFPSAALEHETKAEISLGTVRNCIQRAEDIGTALSTSWPEFTTSIAGTNLLDTVTFSAIGEALKWLGFARRLYSCGDEYSNTTMARHALGFLLPPGKTYSIKFDGELGVTFDNRDMDGIGVATCGAYNYHAVQTGTEGEPLFTLCLVSVPIIASIPWGDSYNAYDVTTDDLKIQYQDFGPVARMPGPLWNLGATTSVKTLVPSYNTYGRHFAQEQVVSLTGCIVVEPTINVPQAFFIAVREKSTFRSRYMYEKRIGPSRPSVHGRYGMFGRVLIDMLPSKSVVSVQAPPLMALQMAQPQMLTGTEAQPLTSTDLRSLLAPTQSVPKPPSTAPPPQLMNRPFYVN